MDIVCVGVFYFVGNFVYISLGVYVDFFINIYGCDSIVYIDFIVLFDFNIIVEYIIMFFFCFNIMDGVIDIVDINNGYFFYELFWEEGVLGINSFIENLLGNISYNLYVIDVFGCQMDISILFGGLDVLSLDLGLDWNLELGDEFSFLVNIIFIFSQYFWISM